MENSNAKQQSQSQNTSKEQDSDDDRLCISLTPRQRATTFKLNKSKTKRKRKRLISDQELLVDKAIEQKLRECARKNNLSTNEMKKLLRTLVKNDHVLAIVKIQEEMELAREKGAVDGAENEDVLEEYVYEDDGDEGEKSAEEAEATPKFTRSAARALNKKPLPLCALSEIQPEPAIAALISEDLHSDDDDEEYDPREEEYASEDDPNTTISDFDSQPCTPKTPAAQTEPEDGRNLERYTDDGLFKLPRQRNDSTASHQEEIIAQRTRSKVCLQETPIEAIESNFIPPDIPLDMYDFDVETDNAWTEFLSNFSKPLNANAEEDDEADPEYVAAEPEPIDSEELKNVNISKKELSDLVAELFDGLVQEGVILEDIHLGSPKKSPEKSPLKKKVKSDSRNEFNTPLANNTKHLSCTNINTPEPSIMIPSQQVNEELHTPPSTQSQTITRNQEPIQFTQMIFRPNVMSTPNGVNTILQPTNITQSSQSTANSVINATVNEKPQPQTQPQINKKPQPQIQPQINEKPQPQTLVEAVDGGTTTMVPLTDLITLTNGTTNMPMQFVIASGGMDGSVGNNQFPLTLIPVALTCGSPSKNIINLQPITSTPTTSQVTIPIENTQSNTQSISSMPVIILSDEESTAEKSASEDIPIVNLLSPTTEEPTSDAAKRKPRSFPPSALTVNPFVIGKSPRNTLREVCRSKYEQLQGGEIPIPKEQTFEPDQMGFTDFQRLVLEQQLRMHVQFIAQSFLQVYSHPILWKFGTRLKDMISELDKHHNMYERTIFNVWNLKLAVKLINDWEKELSMNCPENTALMEFIYDEIDKAKHTFGVTRFPPRVMKQIIRSPVFIYGHLLPKMPFKPYEATHTEMIPTVDQLLATSLYYTYKELEEFEKKERPEKPKIVSLSRVTRHISRNNIYGKSPESLAIYVKKRKDDPTYNPIKYFYEHRKPPPYKHILYVVDFDKVLPPEQRLSTLPFIWREFGTRLRALEIEKTCHPVKYAKALNTIRDYKDPKLGKTGNVRSSCSSTRSSANITIHVNYVYDSQENSFTIEDNNTSSSNANLPVENLPIANSCDKTCRNKEISNSSYPSNNNPNNQFSKNNYPNNFPNNNYPNNNYLSDHFPNTSFPNTSFPNTSFANTSFPNTSFPNTSFPNANFPNTNLSNTNFPNTSFPNTNFPNTSFANTSFPNTSCPNTNFSNTSCSNTNFSNNNLPDTNSLNTNFPHNKSLCSNYSNNNLPSNNLSSKNLSNTNLSNINLPPSNTNIPSTKFPSTNLPDTNTPHTNLSGTNLPETGLSETKLPDTNLSRANLPDTSLPDINTPTANLLPEQTTPGSPVDDKAPATRPVPELSCPNHFTQIYEPLSTCEENKLLDVYKFGGHFESNTSRPSSAITGPSALNSPFVEPLPIPPAEGGARKQSSPSKYLSKGQKLVTDYFKVAVPDLEKEEKAKPVSFKPRRFYLKLRKQEVRKNRIIFQRVLRKGVRQKKQLKIKIQRLLTAYQTTLNKSLNQFKNPILRRVFAAVKSLEIYTDLLNEFKSSLESMKSAEECAAKKLVPVKATGDEEAPKTRKPYRVGESLRQMLQQESKEDTNEKDAVFAMNFFDKVEKTLCGAGHHDRYKSFQKILKGFDPQKDRVADLYYKMETLFLPEYPHLAEVFLAFLLPAEAIDIGKFFEHFMITNMGTFVNKLNIFFNKQPAQIKKVYGALSELAEEQDLSIEQVKSKILPLLKGNKFLTDWFLQSFESEKPNQSISNVYENVNMKQLESQQGETEIYESVQQKDILEESTDTNQCQLKYINGGIYYGSRILLPAKLSFQAIELSKCDEEEDNVPEVDARLTGAKPCVHGIRECAEQEIKNHLDKAGIENQIKIDDDKEKEKFVLCDDLTFKAHAARLNPALYKAPPHHSFSNLKSKHSDGETSPKKQCLQKRRSPKKNLPKSPTTAGKKTASISENSKAVGIAKKLKSLTGSSDTESSGGSKSKRKQTKTVKTVTFDLAEPSAAPSNSEGSASDNDRPMSEIKRKKVAGASLSMDDSQSAGSSSSMCVKEESLSSVSSPASADVAVWTRDEDKIILEEVKSGYNNESSLITRLIMKLPHRTESEISTRHHFLMDVLTQLQGKGS